LLDGLRKMFFDFFCGHSWPCGELVVTDGLEEGSRGRAKKGLVKEFNDVGGGAFREKSVDGVVGMSIRVLCTLD
jgi:hypothetical protein